MGVNRDNAVPFFFLEKTTRILIQGISGCRVRLTEDGIVGIRLKVEVPTRSRHGLQDGCISLRKVIT